MNLVLICSPEDIPYLANLKSPLSGHKVTVRHDCPEFILPLTSKYEGIICSNEKFLNVLVKKSRRVTLKDYAGSFFERNGKPCLVINPLAQVHTLPFGKFLLERYLTKITKPEMWQNSIPFTWKEITNEDQFLQLYALSQRSTALAIDIETVQEPELAITICSYSAICEEQGKLNLTNFTFAIDSMIRWSWMKSLNEIPHVPKIFQNGIYDNSWFLRYGTPPANWTFDTMDMFHSWYSELPKRLDFVASFCVRDSWFWKNDGKTGKWEDYCEYGCRDVWATSCAFLYLIEAMPDWAWRNYLAKFPVNFPALLAGVRGWRIDENKREALKEEKIPEIEAAKTFLGNIVRNQSFNPGSPKQVQALYSIISSKPVQSSDEETTKKVGAQHPFNQLICDKILEYREESKIVSTYLNARLIHGRFLYSLSPSGTDTNRLSSRGSFLWSGGNIQNIPRGSVVKSCFVSDDGYYLAEPDASQADARGMAYLSGDEELIATVESPLDFHTVNATKFFGLLYDQITEVLRDLIKRVGHGVNFNMAEDVLLATMGAENAIRAQQLLQLPKTWTLRKVCGHLIDVYHKVYPGLRRDYYPYLMDIVRATHKYTGPTGLTRWFFGDPKNSKHELNLLIAHTAQSLTGQVINQGFRKLWAMERKTNGDIKILAQIHDSAPFQYRIGRLDLAIDAAKMMEIPIRVKDCRGKERTMTLPIGLKAEAARWSELKKINMIQGEVLKKNISGGVADVSTDNRSPSKV